MVVLWAYRSCRPGRPTLSHSTAQASAPGQRTARMSMRISVTSINDFA